jgi:hypothetical protein
LVTFLFLSLSCRLGPLKRRVSCWLMGPSCHPLLVECPCVATGLVYSTPKSRMDYLSLYPRPRSHMHTKQITAKSWQGCICHPCFLTHQFTHSHLLFLRKGRHLFCILATKVNNI